MLNVCIQSEGLSLLPHLLHVGFAKLGYFNFKQGLIRNLDKLYSPTQNNTYHQSTQIEQNLWVDWNNS